MDNNFKKFCAFVCVLMATLAIIGGTAYLLYDGHIFVGSANLCLGVLAVPYIVERVKKLLK
jgi:hypothetical protein